MHIHHPEMADEWERHTQKNKKLPKHVKKEWSTWTRTWAPDEKPDPKPNDVECSDDGHMSLYEMFGGEVDG